MKYYATKAEADKRVLELETSDPGGTYTVQKDQNGYYVLFLGGFGTGSLLNW